MRVYLGYGHVDRVFITVFEGYMGLLRYILINETRQFTHDISR